MSKEIFQLQIDAAIAYLDQQEHELLFIMGLDNLEDNQAYIAYLQAIIEARRTLAAVIVPDDQAGITITENPFQAQISIAYAFENEVFISSQNIAFAPQERSSGGHTPTQSPTPPASEDLGDKADDQPIAEPTPTANSDGCLSALFGCTSSSSAVTSNAPTQLVSTEIEANEADSQLQINNEDVAIDSLSDAATALQTGANDEPKADEAAKEKSSNWFTNFFASCTGSSSAVPQAQQREGEITTDLMLPVAPAAENHELDAATHGQAENGANAENNTNIVNQFIAIVVPVRQGNNFGLINNTTGTMIPAPQAEDQYGFPILRGFEEQTTTPTTPGSGVRTTSAEPLSLKFPGKQYDHDHDPDYNML